LAVINYSDWLRWQRVSSLTISVNIIPSVLFVNILMLEYVVLKLGARKPAGELSEHGRQNLGGEALEMARHRLPKLLHELALDDWEILTGDMEELREDLRKFRPDTIKCSFDDCNQACRLLETASGLQTIYDRLGEVAHAMRDEGLAPRIVLEWGGLIDAKGLGGPNFTHVKPWSNDCLHQASSVQWVAAWHRIGAEVLLQSGYPLYLNPCKGRNVEVAEQVTHSWIASLSPADQQTPWNCLAWGAGDRAIDLDVASQVLRDLPPEEHTRDCLQPFAPTLQRLKMEAEASQRTERREHLDSEEQKSVNCCRCF